MTTAGPSLGQTPACSVLRPPGLEAGAEQVCKALGGEENKKIMVGFKIELIRQEDEEGMSKQDTCSFWVKGQVLLHRPKGAEREGREGLCQAAKLLLHHL